MEWISDPGAWAALVTLTALEIVLGVDNIIFIAILAGRLPVDRQAKARRLGILVALASRLALLLSITWIMRLTTPLFTVLGNEITGRDLILLIGGLFLIGKAVHELHAGLEGEDEEVGGRGAPTLAGILTQILLIDIVFSIDSVITAVGMADELAIMVIAMVLAVAFMLFAAGPLANFVDRHPTVKVLALAFLVVIGINLVAEGMGQHIPKGYTYFAMAFSVAVEMLNIRVRKRASRAVRLHGPRGEAVPSRPAT
jgi:predicted tellurium resistance membrane protein TerC